MIENEIIRLGAVSDFPDLAFAISELVEERNSAF